MFEHCLTAERYLNLLEDHVPELLEDVQLEVTQGCSFSMTVRQCSLWDV
jgi:hypothetical protein